MRIISSSPVSSPSLLRLMCCSGRQQRRLDHLLISLLDEVAADFEAFGVLLEVRFERTRCSERDWVLIKLLLWRASPTRNDFWQGNCTASYCSFKPLGFDERCLAGWHVASKREAERRKVLHGVRLYFGRCQQQVSLLHCGSI